MILHMKNFQSLWVISQIAVSLLSSIIYFYEFVLSDSTFRYEHQRIHSTLLLLETRVDIEIYKAVTIILFILSLIFILDYAASFLFHRNLLRIRISSLVMIIVFSVNTYIGLRYLYWYFL